MTPDFIVLHCNHLPRCRHSVDKHFDGYFTLQLMTAGSVWLAYDREPSTMTGAWVWTCQPGPRIRFGPGPTGWWAHRYLAFQGRQVTRWQAEGLWFHGAQRCPARILPSLVKRVDAARAAFRQGDPWAARRAQNLVESILIDLAAARRRAESEEPWLATVLRALEDAPLFHVDFARIAREAGMGTSTLRRKFRERTGTTLHDFVLQRRVAEARRLLGETDLPAKAIAERLGYEDVFYFYRQFRRLHGSSALTFRRSRQA